MLKRNVLVAMFLWVLVMFFTQQVFAEENYCLDGTPSFSYSGYYVYGGWGDGSEINDDSESSYAGVWAQGGANHGSGASYNAAVEFDSAQAKINKVEHVFSCTLEGYVTGGIYVTTYLYYNGGWNQIDSFSVINDDGWSGTREINGPWYNVEAVKVYVITQTGLYTLATARTYEIRAFGASLPDGHWWKLDECDGNTAGDSVDDDDGTFSNGDPCWVDGLFDCAVDFDGVNDYFSVPGLEYSYNHNDTFTVAGWFKTSQSSGMQTIVGRWANYKPMPYPSVPTLYYGWQVLVENNKVVARFGPGSPTISDITGTSDVNDGEWHHFALIYPTNDANAVLYVDINSEGTPGAKNFTADYKKFRLGDGSYAVNGNGPVLKGSPFNGVIDDIMIFDYALTAGEVEELYERGQ